METVESIVARFRDLQVYVDWTAADVERLAASSRILVPHFVELVDDFYDEIRRHPLAAQVITGGKEQIERLKATLVRWLHELMSGPYDEHYVLRRARVGLRHVEIGLPQVYTAVALSRLRSGMLRILCQKWRQGPESLALCIVSLNKLLDLDLAIIGDAYEHEYVARQQELERRRLDDALHREKELSGGLLTYAQAAVLILDSAGRIVRYNPFLESLAAGLDDDTLADSDWFDRFLAPQDRDPLREALLRDIPNGHVAPLTVSSTVECPSGRRHLHWSAVQLRSAAGMPFAILVIGHDITDLHEAQQRALRAERLAAIGQMATGLAHESRNALQKIGASAEMLELELEGNNKALALVERIQQSQRNLHLLLDEVRTYAAPLVLDRSRCRITEVWREAWDLLHAQRAAKRATLKETIEVMDLAVDVDRFRLVQVFRNLLENALAASDEARIDLTCEGTTINGSPAFCIRVRDYGTGMNPEQRRRIFEPFFTTKPTGTGLGTAIAQRIVEAHGGTISVGDCEPPGAEIVVTLPISA